MFYSEWDIITSVAFLIHPLKPPDKLPCPVSHVTDILYKFRAFYKQVRSLYKHV